MSKKLVLIFIIRVTLNYLIIAAAAADDDDV